MNFLPFTFFNDIIYWLIFIVCKMSERKFMVTFHVFKRSDCTCLMRKHRKVVKLHVQNVWILNLRTTYAFSYFLSYVQCHSGVLSYLTLKISNIEARCSSFRLLFFFSIFYVWVCVMSMTGDISKTAISALAVRVQKLRPLFLFKRGRQSSLKEMWP